MEIRAEHCTLSQDNHTVQGAMFDPGDDYIIQLVTCTNTMECTPADAQYDSGASSATMKLGILSADNTITAKLALSPAHCDMTLQFYIYRQRKLRTRGLGYQHTGNATALLTSDNVRQMASDSGLQIALRLTQLDTETDYSWRVNALDLGSMTCVVRGTEPAMLTELLPEMTYCEELQGSMQGDVELRGNCRLDMEMALEAVNAQAVAGDAIVSTFAEQLFAGCRGVCPSHYDTWHSGATMSMESVVRLVEHAKRLHGMDDEDVEHLCETNPCSAVAGVLCTALKTYPNCCVYKSDENVRGVGDERYSKLEVCADAVFKSGDSSGYACGDCEDLSHAVISAAASLCEHAGSSSNRSVKSLGKLAQRLEFIVVMCGTRLASAGHIMDSESSHRQWQGTTTTHSVAIAVDRSEINAMLGEDIDRGTSHGSLGAHLIEGTGWVDFHGGQGALPCNPPDKIRSRSRAIYAELKKVLDIDVSIPVDMTQEDMYRYACCTVVRGQTYILFDRAHERMGVTMSDLLCSPSKVRLDPLHRKFTSDESRAFYRLLSHTSPLLPLAPPPQPAENGTLTNPVGSGWWGMLRGKDAHLKDVTGAEVTWTDIGGAWRAVVYTQNSSGNTHNVY